MIRYRHKLESLILAVIMYVCARRSVQPMTAKRQRTRRVAWLS